MDLKKKQESQVQLLKQKQRSEEAAKKLQEEIQYIKAQKVVASAEYMLPLSLSSATFLSVWIFFIVSILQVQLQHKIKQEAEQFRQWKASREKELLQVHHLSWIILWRIRKKTMNWLTKFY